MTMSEAFITIFKTENIWIVRIKINTFTSKSYIEGSPLNTLVKFTKKIVKINKNVMTYGKSLNTNPNKSPKNSNVCSEKDLAPS